MGSDAGDVDKQVEEGAYESVRVPRGKQFILAVFQGPGSAGFDLTMSGNINAGQILGLAGILDEEGRGIIRMAKAQQQRIVPGRA